MWLVFHGLDAGAFLVSTGIHYQDTARGIRKELSFHKVFLKTAKPLT
jgi:hypothetical protein